MQGEKGNQTMFDTTLDATLAFIVAAAALNGLLAGASLDQSIKQLPARRRIGAVAYSVYSRASDLGNGVVWYAFLGVGGALLAIVAAVLTLFAGSTGSTGSTESTQSNTAYALPVYVAAVLSILHSIVTAVGAPTNFSQREHEGDEAALSSIFNRFARLQALRATLQALTFAALLWALAAYPG
jgi:hypothetical protein